MREGEEKEWAIVCSPLPPCVLLHSFENDISSPPKERLFSSALCVFTQLQARAGLFLRVSHFPHDGIICSARCALMHTTLLSITHRAITPMTDSFECVFSGCCRIINWRDFLTMLLGTSLTYCPCESLLYTCTQ